MSPAPLISPAPVAVTFLRGIMDHKRKYQSWASTSCPESCTHSVSSLIHQLRHMPRDKTGNIQSLIQHSYIW